VNFEINGTDLLLRDINIYCTTKANQRSILEQMKQMVVGNNTTGATIFDLGNIMQSESLAELNNILKATERKADKQRQEQMQHEQQMQEQAQQTALQQKQMEIDAEMRKEEMRNRTTLLAAEIKSAGYGAMQDINANQQSDYMDAMDRIQSSQEFQQVMSFDQQKEGSKVNLAREKNALAKEKLQAQIAMKQMDVNIARENKNRFDAGKKVPPKKKK
jgi:hypothetical protein